LVEKLKDRVLRDALKCSFCGFCEVSCPTNFIIKRNYTPRGRIGIVIFALKNGIATIESVAGIFSCLGCGACVEYCPAEIDIPEVVRNFRYILRAEDTGVSDEVR